MNVIESMRNYPKEEQVNILATLNVVQGKGWSPENPDPFQFHIILGERIRAQDEKIKSLEEDSKNNEEQDKQKEKDNKDLRNNLQNEKEVCEDLEKEVLNMESDLKKAEKLVEILKHGLGNKDSIIDGLNKILKEKDDEINKLNEAVAKVEKKDLIQNNVIKELKDNLKNKEEIINHSEKEELDKLMDEIKQLEAVNKEKEIMLENVKLENEKLNVQLGKLMSIKENVSLGDELNMHISKTFNCEECGESFDMRSEMKMHVETVHEKVNEKKLWKAKLKEKEIEVCSQKFKISSEIFSLKEKEISLNKICRCKGFCRINHYKHSWSQSKSTNLFEKMLNLNVHHVAKLQGAVQKSYTCDSCEEKFVKMVELKKHKKTIHKCSTATIA